MEQQNKNSEVNNFSNQSLGLDGTATHSGWQHFYIAYAKYRDECIMLSRIVMGNNIQQSIDNLSNYYSSLYSVAQQTFSFYTEEIETQLTLEWIALGTKVNNYMALVTDKQFRSQMAWDGEVSIPVELKVDLLKYFNKVDRMATEAGLKVLKEDKEAKEPKKGMLGLNK